MGVSIVLGFCAVVCFFEFNISMNSKALLSSLVYYNFSNVNKVDKDMEEMLLALNGPDEVIYFANHLKTEGNALFKQGRFNEASKKYTKAVKSLCFVTPLERNVEASFKELVILLNLNLAACYIKLDKTYKALEICTLIL